MPEYTNMNGGWSVVAMVKHLSIPHNIQAALGLMTHTSSNDIVPSSMSSCDALALSALTQTCDE